MLTPVRVGRNASSAAPGMPKPGAMGGGEAGRVEKRRFPRQGLRIPCGFRSGGEEGRGFVTDVSAGGLFLQTMARLEPGREVHLSLHPPDAPAIEVLGIVARSRVGHRDAVSVLRPGIGVQIEAAPEAWYQLVLEATHRT